MEVRVKLYSTLRHHLPPLKPGEYYRAVLSDGARVSDLLLTLGVPLEVARVAFVNGESVPLDHVLQEGDDVGVFPPVVGGSRLQRRLARDKKAAVLTAAWAGGH